MNTPAHLVFGLSAFGRPDSGKVTAGALAGALIPDASLYLLSVWHLWILGTPAQTVFGELYFSESWQAIFRVDNSFVVWGLLLSVAIMAKSRWAIALCGAALLHLLLDFPFHNDDARSHFWPITNWKFVSPVSYWDPAHFGSIVSVAELLLVLGLSVWLWRRFTGGWMRGLIGLLASLQIAPVVIWALMFS